MTYKTQILLGRIFRVHGYEGAVQIRLEKNFIENIPEMESVFIETEGIPVPFFISDSEYGGGDILKIKFNGYGSVEKVSGFVGSSVFLTASGKSEDPGGKSFTLKGFRVSLINGNLLGYVTDIIHNPGQDLLKILTMENREILVPLHEDLIEKINRKSGIIILDLPEGLIELNSTS